jgi:hypothetical protein
MNPAPDAELASVGEYNHNWIVNSLTDFILRNIEEGIGTPQYRWSEMLNPPAKKAKAATVTRKPAERAATRSASSKPAEKAVTPSKPAKPTAKKAAAERPRIKKVGGDK